MTTSLLTYNLFFSSAITHISKITKLYSPDILCFQEMITDEKNFKILEELGYKLTDFSNSFIKFGKVYGLATFYNEKTLTFLSSKSLTLPRSYPEILLFIMRGAHIPRTVLKTDFKDKNTGKKFTVYNLHLTPWATNGIRVRQIQETLSDLNINKLEHVLIAGDFNYPYGRRKFEELITQYGLAEATSNLYYTLQSKLFRLIPIKLKLDYVLYKGVEFKETQRLSINFSDHFPILSSFQI